MAAGLPAAAAGVIQAAGVIRAGGGPAARGSAP